MSDNSRLVYSTETGRIKPEPSKQKTTTPRARDPQGDGIVRLHRETKGRGGKAVTRISGLPLAGKELKALAKQLKQLCGTGGSVNEEGLIIQGDQREKLKPALEAKGYKVKLAGG